jgi:hypothetical protein
VVCYTVVTLLLHLLHCCSTVVTMYPCQAKLFDVASRAENAKEDEAVSHSDVLLSLVGSPKRETTVEQQCVNSVTTL